VESRYGRSSTLTNRVEVTEVVVTVTEVEVTEVEPKLGRSDIFVDRGRGRELGRSISPQVGCIVTVVLLGILRLIN